MADVVLREEVLLPAVDEAETVEELRVVDCGLRPRLFARFNFDFANLEEWVVFFFKFSLSSSFFESSFPLRATEAVS